MELAMLANQNGQAYSGRRLQSRKLVSDHTCSNLPSRDPWVNMEKKVSIGNVFHLVRYI